MMETTLTTPDNMLKCFKFCKPKGQEMDTLGNHPIENNPFPAHICQQLGINASFWPKMMRNEWGGGGFSHPTIAAINNCFSLTREED